MSNIEIVYRQRWLTKAGATEEDVAQNNRLRTACDRKPGASVRENRSPAAPDAPGLTEVIYGNYV